jgi:hypothetical protein
MADEHLGKIFRLLDVLAVEVAGGRNDAAGLRAEMHSGFDRIDRRLDRLETGVEGVETELGIVKVDLASVKMELGSVKTELGFVKTELRSFRAEFERRTSRLEQWGGL